MSRYNAINSLRFGSFVSILFLTATLGARVIAAEPVDSDDSYACKTLLSIITQLPPFAQPVSGTCESNGQAMHGTLVVSSPGINLWSMNHDETVVQFIDRTFRYAAGAKGIAYLTCDSPIGNLCGDPNQTILLRYSSLNGDW